MKKLLWVGDAACPSGFARATHEILKSLDFRCGGPFEVTVMGINYRGDPHDYPYPIFPAAVAGDWMGVKRLIWMCDFVQPDAVIIQQDGWNLPFYTRQMQNFEEYKNVPVIAAVAVDGENFQAPWLENVALTIFWTEFAQNEAQKAGHTGKHMVIPLGVDLETYRPVDRAQARQALGVDPSKNVFIIGNVNRNQPRKRWDLTVKYFAEWVKEQDIQDAYLFLHAAPTGDTGVDIIQLAKYYDIVERVAIRQPPTWIGVPESDMCATYNAFDLQISTTQGEGFGLTTFEGMACHVAQIVPAWSGLKEITQNAACQVPCTTTAIGPPYVNVIGGIPDGEAFKKAIDDLYVDDMGRQELACAGFRRVQEPRYRWENIGQAWVQALREVL